MSFADSPFSGVTFDAFYLETFEDGSLNTPGVSASTGFVLGPSPTTDSVDADDGTVDGSGTAGHSYYVNASAVTFTFSAAALGGQLPTDVGIVWTDVGYASPTNGYGDVQLEAFDSNGVSLGVFGPFAVGDGAYDGGTGEDLFLGVIDSGGISKITVSMPGSSDWEIDHLQYGVRAVPAPAALPVILAALGGFGFAGRRRWHEAS